MDAGGTYLLGLDAGQTSTKGILASRDGRVVVQQSGGAVDHFRQRGARARNEAVVAETIDALCRSAGISQEEITSVGIGWTAARPDTPEIAIIREIVASILPHARIAVVPDYVLSLLGASGGEPGIVVVAGGGAIAYGIAPDGSDAVVGGMGYLLGDEGSAYDIGRRAIASAARSSDGRDRQTALEGLIRETFGVEEVRDITQLVYAEGFSRARIAHLAPAVAECAEAGDEVAVEIMTTAGEELGRAAVAVARKLEWLDPIIYVAGGVFRAGDLVLRPFRRFIERKTPGAGICRPAYTPVVGALLLARRVAGALNDSAWLSTVADMAEH